MDNFIPVSQLTLRQDPVYTIRSPKDIRNSFQNRPYKSLLLFQSAFLHHISIPTFKPNFL